MHMLEQISNEVHESTFKSLCGKYNFLNNVQFIEN